MVAVKVRSGGGSLVKLGRFDYNIQGCGLWALGRGLWAVG